MSIELFKVNKHEVCDYGLVEMYGPDVGLSVKNK